MRRIRPDLSESQKADRDDDRFATERHDALMNAGVKGLAVLNSAGVAAMLGFLQALLNSPGAFVRFKGFGVAALALYLAGAVAASLVFLPLVRYINRDSGEDKVPLHSQASALLTCAVVCAISGSVTVAIGVFYAL